MFNLKKALATSMAVLMSSAICLTSSMAATPFPDVADTDSFAEAVTVLNALGIMQGDDKGFRPDDTIKRSEVAAVVIRATGLDAEARGMTGVSPFSDVPADHWAAGYIALGTQTGLINGMGDGTFAPEDPVTYAQTCKLLVAALGYTPQAEANGGFPGGYMRVASSKQITSGAQGGGDEAAKRSVVGRLVFNALDVAMMGQTVFKTDGTAEYEETKGENKKTLLVSNLRIDKVEGVVTESYYMQSGVDFKTAHKTIRIDIDNINGVREATTGNQDPYVSAGDLTFGNPMVRVGENETAVDLVGYYVSAYIRDPGASDQTLVAIAKKQGRNAELVVPTSSFRAASGSTPSGSMLTTGRFSYYVNPDRDTRATDIVMNSDTAKRRISYNNSNFSALNNGYDVAAGIFGYVTFISNDSNDTDYEYVKQTGVREDFLVASIEENRNRVTDKEDKTLTFNPDDSAVEYRYVNEQGSPYKEDGTPYSFSDIKVGNVLSLVYADKNYRTGFVTVYISGSTVEGIVSEVETDPTDTDEYSLKTKYTIAGNQYKRSVGTEFGIKSGDEGIFYLNMLNRIVYKETVSSSKGNYAILFGAADKAGVSGQTIEVKLLTAQGEWLTRELARKTTFYGPEPNGEAILDTTPTDFKNAYGDAIPTGPQTTFTTGPVRAAVLRAVVDLQEKSPPTSDDGIFTVDMSQPAGERIRVNKAAANTAVVKYDLNSSGQISRIYFAEYSSDFTVDTNQLNTAANTDPSEYEATSRRLGSIYFKESSLVFSVPDSAPADNDNDNEENYTVGSYSTILKDGVQATWSISYDFEDGGPNITLVAGVSATFGKGDRVVVVDSVSRTLNASGDTVYLIRGYQNGFNIQPTTGDPDSPASVTLTTGDNFEAYTMIPEGSTTNPTAAPAGRALTGNLDAKLRRGDAILVGFNAKKEISRLVVIMTTDYAIKAGKLKSSATGTPVPTSPSDIQDKIGFTVEAKAVDNNASPFNHLYFGWLGDKSGGTMRLYEHFIPVESGKTVDDFSMKPIFANRVTGTSIKTNFYEVDTEPSNNSLVVSSYGDLTVEKNVSTTSTEYAYFGFAYTYNNASEVYDFIGYRVPVEIAGGGITATTTP